MSYCHVSAQADRYARDLDDELRRESIADAVTADYEWRRLSEIGRALNMCENDIADALVEYRMHAGENSRFVGRLRRSAP